ncbi:MAG: hypothetical protein PUA51_06240 [Oscillospiraceae bacterium]|nr:hypothetical protein [Oscillospiraceae bacterium]
MYSVNHEDNFIEQVKNMNSFNFKRELKFILLWSLSLDLIAYGISVLFIGINICFLTGLAVGNTALFVNLWLLNRSVSRIAASGGRGKNPMMGGYLLRSLIACTAVVISFRFDWINTVGAVLPLFYPKVIYTLHSIVKGGK